MNSHTTVQKAIANVVDEIRIITRRQGSSRDEKLQSICQLLHHNVEEFDWVGFYLVAPEAERELVLGPFTGEPTEHTRIPFGKGICGQAADSKETFVVQDVAQEKNYLACSTEVEAEIVLPVIKEGRFIAELDIDSHTKNAITEQHEAILQKICDIVAEIFNEKYR